MATDAPNPMSNGSNFRNAVEAEIPLQVVGTINAYSARLAERAGFKAIYLSGAGVANAGTQQAMVAEMQTRRDLYDVLNYHAFEEKLDELFAKRKRP